MKRAELLFQQLEPEILAGAFGRSGDRFLSVRDFAKRYACSLHCTLDVIGLLLRSHIIRRHGKHYYITTGYCPSHSAYGKILHKNQRNLFGVLVRDHSNPFFNALIHHLSNVLHRSGMELIVSCSGNDPKRETRIMEMFLELNCKGVFSCVTLLPQQEKLFSRYPLPIVALAEDTGISSIDAILVDNYAAGTQVAKHLLECGNKSYAYITLDDYVASDLRLRGFRDFLEQKQLSLPEENVGIVSAADEVVRARELKQFIHKLLNPAGKANCPLPIGIFCVHDLVAADVMRIVKHHPGKRKPRIPENVMIVGFDDLPIATQLSIPLTTVSYPYSSISQRAFDVMMDHLHNPRHTPGRYEISSSLVVRGSTHKGHPGKASDTGF